MVWLAKAKQLFTSRVFWYGVLVLAFLVTIWSYGNRQYNLGFKEAEAEYESRIEEERERLEKANEKALKEALSRVEELNRNLELRDAQLRDIRRRTQEGDGAGDRSLSADRVRELNRID